MRPFGSPLPKLPPRDKLESGDFFASDLDIAQARRGHRRRRCRHRGCRCGKQWRNTASSTLPKSSSTNPAPLLTMRRHRGCNSAMDQSTPIDALRKLSESIQSDDRGPSPNVSVTTAPTQTRPPRPWPISGAAERLPLSEGLAEQIRRGNGCSGTGFRRFPQHGTFQPSFSQILEFPGRFGTQQ